MHDIRFPHKLPFSTYSIISIMCTRLFAEEWWNSMATICESSFDDQQNLNCGLLALSVHWVNNDTSYQNTTIHATTRTGMTVAVLPYDNICRQLTCDPKQRARFFVWHKGGGGSRKTNWSRPNTA